MRSRWSGLSMPRLCGGPDGGSDRFPERLVFEVEGWKFSTQVVGRDQMPNIWPPSVAQQPFPGPAPAGRVRGVQSLDEPSPGERVIPQEVGTKGPFLRACREAGQEGRLDGGGHIHPNGSSVPSDTTAICLQ